MSLDASTASELLKGIDAEIVQELAVEAAYLDASGYRNSRQSIEYAKQFCESLQSKPKEFELKKFLKEMLKGTVGDQKAAQIQSQINNLLQQKDPFIPIRQTNLKTLAAVLEKEHPQAIAVVLSEMQTKKSSEILSLLHESVQVSTVRRMVNCDGITAEAKNRIAEMVNTKLKSFQTGATVQVTAVLPEQSLRKVAIILRNLGKELRDGMLIAISEKDDQAGRKVADLMIVWEDLPLLVDRGLQEALRTVEAKTLALALMKADETIANKIKSNISERALAAVEEEASLMSAPKKEDTEQARESILKQLREMNRKGELSFIEE